MSFSCFIVGQGNLPIQCAEILQRRGHQVYGIVSADAALLRWAEGRRIPHVEPTGDLRAFLGARPFDYLFSIVNEHILPGAVLELPSKYAINYHDSPLPRYAGTHATAWALLNREKTHAVSWHVVRGMVDAGEILKQRPVEIADGETSFTLNAKCF